MKKHLALMFFSVLNPFVLALTYGEMAKREAVFTQLYQDYDLGVSSFHQPQASTLTDCALKCLNTAFCFYYSFYESQKDARCKVFKGIHHDTRQQLEALLRPLSGCVIGHVIPKGPYSCFDYLRLNKTPLKNGIYRVRNIETFQEFDVMCDFTSEPGYAWTLVVSSKRNDVSRKQMPYTVNTPINERTPNFNAFRLSLSSMKTVQKASTHWRITCEYQKLTKGDLYKDYIRAKFADFDMLTFHGSGVCKKVEFLGLRGYNCTDCTVPWWSNGFHIDSSNHNWDKCGTKRLPGYIHNEDDFGWYYVINVNHTCAATGESTTNTWMGGIL